MKWIAGAGLPRLTMMLAVVGTLGVLGCGDDDENGQAPSVSVSVEKVAGDDQVGETGRELPDPIVVRVRDRDGNGMEGETVAFSITGGGGSVSEASVVTGSDGLASVRWTMGAPPVWNRLKSSAGDDEAEFTARADPGEKPVLELVLEGTGFDLSNEDLAFEKGRGLFLGTRGAILNVPAPGSSPVAVHLTGETVESPVGIAFGTAGDLYVCDNPDSTGSVKRIRPSGLCEVLSRGFGGAPFALPNYIAVHSSGEIYLSSTCDDMIYRISPATGETTEFRSIPGPNGLAFDAAESYLYILTENPAVFCAPSQAAWGSLYRVPIGPGGEAGGIEPLVQDFGLAGDGLAFDEEGNLYAVFSGYIERKPLRLFESGVFVYTPDGRFHEFFTVNVLEGEIITNVAFGVDPFDPASLYCYGFSGKLYRVEVGIRGKPLPAQAVERGPSAALHSSFVTAADEKS